MKETKKSIYFYKAECGDAARIRYLGNDGEYHNIFIDSGYRRTFKNIIARHINEIQANEEAIDLWIISHIHDDHIGGIEQYLRQIEIGQSIDTVESWFYNSPRKGNRRIKEDSVNVSGAKSIRQGDILSQYLEAKGKLPEKDIVFGLEPIDFYGMKLFILSPNLNKLERLREKYESDPELPFERQEGETISEAKAVVQDDYHINLKDFNLSEWKEDNSIENGSSISVLSEYNGFRVLWLADSHPSDIIDSLRKLGYSESNKIRCEWVKVTHHGSKANNSNELYSLIECKNYVFSANGMNKHKLPTKESVARIIRNEHRDVEIPYNLYFTYDNEVLRSIFSRESDNIFKELNFNVHFQKEGDFLLTTITERTLKYK